MESRHLGHVLELGLSLAARHLLDAEIDQHRDDETQRAGDVEDRAPAADHRRDDQGQDHADQVSEGLRELENAVDLAAQAGAEIVGDEGIEARIGGVVNAGGGAGGQEAAKGAHDGIHPGGGAPDQRGQREQSGARVAVIQVAPDRIEDGGDDEGAGIDEAPLLIIDVEGLTDGDLQGADHQLVSLVQEHEEEKDNDHEPAVARALRSHADLVGWDGLSLH